VFRAHRLVHHSTLGLRVIKKKREAHHISPRGSIRATAGSAASPVRPHARKQHGPHCPGLYSPSGYGYVVGPYAIADRRVLRSTRIRLRTRHTTPHPPSGLTHGSNTARIARVCFLLLLLYYSPA